MREQATSAIVEYVPALHSPDLLEENQHIKRDSELGEGALQATRWIKPARDVPQDNGVLTSSQAS